MSARSQMVQQYRHQERSFFHYIQENLDDIITVEDEELIPCFLDLLENHKMLAENSGLLTIAALKHLDVKNKK